MDKLTKAMNKATAPAKPAPGGKKGKKGGTMSQTVTMDRAVMERNRVMTEDSPPRIRDVYSLLRTQLLHRTRDEGHNCIMVTSSVPGEGETLTAVNLAISLATEMNQYALLVDTHLREPVIDKMFGFKAERGLTDYLIKDVPAYELIIKPDIDKLTILPAGTPIAGSTELLGSPKMKTFVEEMKERYPDRYVIFNCPQLLSTPDSLVFSNYVDAIILVVAAGETSRYHVKKAMDLLKGKNLLGTVLNKAIEDIDPV